LIDRFRYLSVSLALVLIVVGAKMLASSWLKTTFGTRANVYLLSAIVLILALGIGASWLANRSQPPGRGRR
jgi:tellurite resistance protein TerC